MKQMPVESFFAQVGMPSRRAMRANIALRDLSQRKEHRRQLLLRQPVQEVALVLGGIGRLEELHAASPARRNRA